MQLDQSLMIGAKVEIRIDFSRNDSFECNGIVLRCQERPQNPDDPRRSYSVALAFEGLEEFKVAYLKGLVDRLLTQENNN